MVMTFTVDWDYFDKFEGIIDKYMLPRGEGGTMASQIVTAVNKLIYMFYNNGDVFDNNYGLSTFGNDIASFANWLVKYANCDVLNDIYGCKNDDDYTVLLKNLADETLNEDFLANYQKEKQGSIYDCDGDFHLAEYLDDDDDDFLLWD